MHISKFSESFPQILAKILIPFSKKVEQMADFLIKTKIKSSNYKFFIDFVKNFENFSGVQGGRSAPGPLRCDPLQPYKPSPGGPGSPPGPEKFRWALMPVT